MPTLRGNAKFNPPIIRAVVIPATAEYFANPTLNVKGVDCRALLDTGADGTSVTRQLAETAGLSYRGKSQVSGIGGAGWHRSWTTFVGVYEEDELGPLPLVFPEPVLSIEVLPYPAFDMIIGRDLLMLGRFTLETTGDFQWELPSRF